MPHPSPRRQWRVPRSSGGPPPPLACTFPRTLTDERSLILNICEGKRQGSPQMREAAATEPMLPRCPLSCAVDPRLLGAACGGTYPAGEPPCSSRRCKGRVCPCSKRIACLSHGSCGRRAWLPRRRRHCRHPRGHRPPPHRGHAGPQLQCCSLPDLHCPLFAMPVQPHPPAQPQRRCGNNTRPDSVFRSEHRRPAP